MKPQTTRTSIFLSVGAATLVALGATAQTTAPSQTATPTTSSSDAAPARLPYGVADVVKLSQAQVSEDVTLNYIHNSGTIYNLSPTDIVYLRNEGVSDKVINAMMDQRQNVPADVANQNALQAQAAAAAGAQVPVSPDPNALQAAPVYVQPPLLYAQAAPAYVPPDTAPPAPSTLYVIPDGGAAPAYYPYPSFYGGGCYGCVSTVYVVGKGYVGHRYYTSGRYYGGHGSTVYHYGRH
jgi:hypothetical protein